MGFPSQPATSAKIAGLEPVGRALWRSEIHEGARFETYALPGERGSGAIVLNGATAHLGRIGDRITVMGYTIADEAEAKSWQPRVIVLGEKNVIINERGI